jgi:tyrosine-specific transport protein
MKSQGNTISAILLVAGTCIGAGMLALPLVTGHAGFWPAMTMNGLCWLFMLATGLLFLEATLWMEDGANVLSMAERFFGLGGKIVCGVSFLFLYYCLMVAYTAGGAPLLAGFLSHIFGFALDYSTSCFIFSGLFGLVVLFGVRAIDRVNTLLMAGLVISYCLMLGTGVAEVQATHLSRQSWAVSFLALPTLFSAFGYHNIIPSLSTYLNRDERKLRTGILIGTLLPLLTYALWQWLVIGSVTESALLEAADRGTPVSHLLQNLANPWIGRLALFFSFFAIVTSVLGVGMSMVDFLADGIHLQERKGWRRLLLCCAVFIPPIFFAWADPKIFLDALAYAGGFGEAVLNGLFPIGMVWIGRYSLNLRSSYRLPGGRLTLVVLLAITLVVIALEIAHAFF